jgi:short-subunit dehydrogenase
MALPPPDPDSTALVTGASSGIGAELARGLAERGHGVTLVARREDRLKSLADELAQEFDVRTEVVPADLAQASERDQLADAIAARGLTVEILVNNAGFGIYAPFQVSDRERELEQVRVLVEAVVDLDARYLPGMVARGRGAILNVASTAGFQPLPGNNTYAAAKSFVLLHTEALHDELRGTGVTATAVSPGPVRSGFQESSEPLFADHLPKLVWSDPPRVARDALRALERGKRSVIPGGFAVKAAFAPNRLTPTPVTAPVTRRLMRGELERGRAEPSS